LGQPGSHAHDDVGKTLAAVRGSVWIVEPSPEPLVIAGRPLVQATAGPATVIAIGEAWFDGGFNAESPGGGARAVGGAVPAARQTRQPPPLRRRGRERLRLELFVAMGESRGSRGARRRLTQQNDSGRHSC